MQFLIKMDKVIYVDPKIQTPCTISVIGSTSSGKTTFISKLLWRNDLFLTKINKILYCYSCFQTLFDEMNISHDNIEFHHDLPSENEIKEFADGRHNLIVLDDLMAKVTSSKTMLDLFCQYSHHLNLTVIFVSQNIFHVGKCSRSLTLNSHYFILFRNRRDINQIGILGRQLFPGKQKNFLNAYKDATKNSFGYLFVDIHPKSNEIISLRTDILNELYNTIYVL